APAIRIDSPGKRQAAPRVAAIQDRAHRQREELDQMSGVHMLGLARHFGNANQMRSGSAGIQGKGSHTTTLMFALSSPSSVARETRTGLLWLRVNPGQVRLAVDSGCEMRGAG